MRTADALIYDRRMPGADEEVRLLVPPQPGDDDVHAVLTPCRFHAPSDLGLERTHGRGRVHVTAGSGVGELYQEGALRLRPLRRPDRIIEVVAINTAGGLTGGDQLDLAVRIDAEASAVVTTAACEKIYRSAGGDAVVQSAVAVASRGRLDWLPQPMILFDGARVRRTLTVAIASGATLLAIEGVILGRTAMGEDLRSASVCDRWRVQRDGALIHADAFRAEGDLRGDLSSCAALAGARAFATALYVAPDAEQRLDMARDALRSCAGETGASAWNGLLAVRFLAADGQMLISDVSQFLLAFRAAPLPRSWLC